MLSSVAIDAPFAESIQAENGTIHASATFDSIGLAVRRDGVEHGLLLALSIARELQQTVC